jgi:putative flippase GtrA
MKYLEMCRRPLAFAGVGVINTGIDFTVLLALSHFTAWPLAIANVLSYSCGLLSSYGLNRSWTFRDRISTARSPIASYACVNIVGLIINCSVMLSLAPILGIASAKLCATGVSFASNYILSSIIVFPVAKEAGKR